MIATGRPDRVPPLRASDVPLAPRPLAAAVIVNWNTRILLLRGLAHLAGACPIIVVDNASQDGSPEAVRAQYPADRHSPTVSLMANTANRGYAAAVNQGVAVTAAPYVLVANADVECPPDTVRQLVDFLERHPHAAIVGPRLHNPDASLQLSWGRDPTFLTEFLQRWWWRRLERQAGQGVLRRWASAPRRVDWVLGACFMLRRDVWQTLGGLDEGYVMYFEEVDLCTRARRAGWDVWYNPEAAAVHHGRASTSQVPEMMALAYRRSQLQYYRRFHGPWAERLLRGYLWAKLGWTRPGRQLLHELGITAG